MKHDNATESTQINNKGMKMKTIVTKQPTLKVLEKKIEKGLEAFREAGESLRIIKEQKLYKGQYGTYEEYCRQRWGFTPQYANKLISATKLIENMIESETTVSVLPNSERQTRALAKADNPSEIWKEAQDSTGKDQPSSKDIESAICKLRVETEGSTGKESEIIDATVLEEPSAPKEEDDNSVLLSILMDIINTPYEMGEKTNRPNISVDVDDASVNLAHRLMKTTGITKNRIVAQALILMETILERDAYNLNAKQGGK